MTDPKILEKTGGFGLAMGGQDDLDVRGVQKLQTRV